MGAQLTALYTPFFDVAAIVCKDAEGVTVSDPADLDGIKRSRDLRLRLTVLRVDADKKRKALKDGALRLGRAIDFGYNLLTAQTDPVEKRLQDQEDIAERIQAERQAKLGQERFSELSKHTAMVPPPPELGKWPRAQYDAYLSGVKAEAARIREEAEAAEVQRIAAEMERAEREAEMQAENERLKAEQAAKDAAHAAQVKAEREAVTLAPVTEADGPYLRGLADAYAIVQARPTAYGFSVALDIKARIDALRGPPACPPGAPVVPDVPTVVIRSRGSARAGYEVLAPGKHPRPLVIGNIVPTAHAKDGLLFHLYWEGDLRETASFPEVKAKAQELLLRDIERQKAMDAAAAATATDEEVILSGTAKEIFNRESGKSK